MALAHISATAEAVPGRSRRSAAAHISLELIGRMAMVALAALAVLVLLPAVIAALAAPPF